MIQISIALVTRNRPESLERCLKSLRFQSVQPYEVIVSDDSDPVYVAYTKEVSERWNCQYISGPRRGLYANRNHAALACQGTHVRTMDDDHEFPELHFHTAQSAVETFPDSIWTFGEYHEYPNSSSKFYPPGEIQPRGFSNLPKDYDDSCAISDGATVYPRSIFDTHRFLELFKFGSLYLEFGARLRSLGYQIRYCPDTYIIHHYIPGQRSYNSQNLNLRTEFFASYLTYSCYRPNFLDKFHCISYFAFLGFLNTIKNRQVFRSSDFYEVLNLAIQYEYLFKTRNFSEYV